MFNFKIVNSILKSSKKFIWLGILRNIPKILNSTKKSHQFWVNLETWQNWWRVNSTSNSNFCILFDIIEQLISWFQYKIVWWVCLSLFVVTKTYSLHFGIDIFRYVALLHSIYDYDWQPSGKQKIYICIIFMETTYPNIKRRIYALEFRASVYFLAR